MLIWIRRMTSCLSLRNSVIILRRGKVKRLLYIMITRVEAESISTCRMKQIAITQKPICGINIIGTVIMTMIKNLIHQRTTTIRLSGAACMITKISMPECLVYVTLQEMHL